PAPARTRAAELRDRLPLTAPARRDPMSQPSVFQQALDYANRANPYPLYAQLRQTPVAQEADGTWVVSTHREIEALLHDPRISSEPRNPPQPSPAPAAPSQGASGTAAAKPYSGQD